ncbi:toxin glutamine deamidase domain-containing protein [Kitasatospora albolonga]|uniref:toxin glutamine deamidase domain-containing protein n=1 Tax=Kitasatospora albolonga TaxID=68173 RepID=UPI0035EA0198
MSRNVPEELAPVLARLGHQWPQADEEGLRRAAGVWREFGAEADRLGRRGGDSAQRVTGENKGRAVDAFAEHWRGFAGGGRGSLDDAHGAAELLAGAFERAARAVDSCKAEIIAVLRELAEEIKLAEKVEAAAKAVLGTVGGAVADAVVGVGEKVAVELARHKVGNLLEELGREMKEGLQQALKEPAVTTLERIAVADGYQSVRAVSAAGGGVAAGALLGGRAVAKVRGLSAVVGRDGEVVKDGQGRPVLVDESGNRVEGVDGVVPQVGADGKPLVGPDGKVAVVGEDGKPVVGLACGSDGKPLRDSTGALVVVGAGGLIAAAGVTVALGRDGKPVTGTDGEVVVLDREGQPVRGSDGHTAKVDRSGELVTDRSGHVVMVDDDGRTAGPETAHGKKPGTGLGLDLGGVGADVQVGPGGLEVDAHLGGNGHGNRHGQEDAYGNGQGNGRGGVQVQVGPVSAGAGSYDPRHDDPYDRNGQGSVHQQDTWRQGGSGGTQPRTVVSVDADPGYQGGGYDRGEDDRPVHRPLGTLRTDSVAVAPPQSGPSSAFGDGPSTGTGWGRHEPSAPSAAGGAGGSGASGGSFGSGGASGGLGPVGGQSGLGTPPMGMGQPTPAAPASPAAPVTAAPPAAGAAGAPVAGGAGGAAAVASPGAAGAPGAGGQAGAVGAVGAVAGPQQPGAAAPRAAQPVGLVPNPVPAPAAPAPPAAGAVVVGPVTGRTFDLPPVGRREDDSPVAVAQAAPLAAMFLLLHDYRRTAPEQPGERARPRVIADGRPYGAAGGLGPVDPAHQAEVERRVPRTEEGEPAAPADPRLGDWPEALNGGGFREPGRSNNALDLSLSALDSYLGNPTCGAPRLPDGPAGEYGGRDRAERELGTQFKDLGYGDDALGQLADLLRQLGTGAQAVLLTLDAYGRSHLWNAFVAGATISYLDPQTGYRSSAPLHPADHGLWAIALEAGGRPVDLSTLQPAIPVVELTPAPALDPLVKPVPEPPAPPRSRLTIHRGSSR